MADKTNESDQSARDSESGPGAKHPREQGDKAQETGAGQEATNRAPHDHSYEHQSGYGGGGANGGANGGASKS